MVRPPSIVFAYYNITIDEVPAIFFWPTLREEGAEFRGVPGTEYRTSGVPGVITESGVWVS